MWERRYGVVRPARSSGGERIYSDADLSRLRLLAAAVRAGRRIGAIARHDSAALERLVGEDEAAGRPRVDAASDDPDDTVIEPMLDAIRGLDSRALDDRLRRAAALYGVPKFLEFIVAPLLRQVGDDWHSGELTIAQEHFASATVTDVVAEMMRAVSAANDAPRLLVTTLPESRHVIGAALAGASAAADGWHVIFLGAELPAAEIVKAAAAADADAVAISVTYTPDPQATVAEIRRLREALPSGVLLVVGGAAIQGLTSDLSAAGIPVGDTLDDLRKRLRKVASRARHSWKPSIQLQR